MKKYTTTTSHIFWMFLENCVVWEVQQALITFTKNYCRYLSIISHAYERSAMIWMLISISSLMLMMRIIWWRYLRVSARNCFTWRFVSSWWNSCTCRQTRCNQQPKWTFAVSHGLLTLSPPIPLRLYTLKWWVRSVWQIFDIRALWRLSARAPECQKLKTVG